MFWRCTLILIVSYVTAGFTKVIDNKREHVSQQEVLKLEDDSLGLAKPSLESPMTNKNIFIEQIKIGKNGNELASLNNLFKFYAKDNAKYKDSLIDFKRVKRQYNGQIYDYSTYPKPLMQNYLPALMPSYISQRKGKQLAIPEQAFTSGNEYLPTAMPGYFSHRRGKQLAIPEQGFTSGNSYLPAAMPRYFSNREGKQLSNLDQAFTSGNAYLPAAIPSSLSHRQGKQLAIPELEQTSGNIYLPATMHNYFSNRQGKQLPIPEPVFTSGIDNLNHPLDYSVQHNIENAYVSPSNHYDYVTKLDENLPWNFQGNHDYLGKPKENVLMISQDYQDYYAPQEYGESISNDYYDEYAAFPDFLSNYANVKQLDNDFLADEPVKDVAVEKQDINSQGITRHENSETMDNNTQIESPLEESNIDDDDANENEDVRLFAKEYIEFTRDKPGENEADETEGVKMEKDDENEPEYDYEESNEKIENHEDILLQSDKEDDDSERKSVTRKGGARVFSIDPEGRISATGLGEEDVQRLIHQVTDIREGRNLAFMEKFEGLISKMLN